MPNEYKRKNKNSLLSFGFEDDILPHSRGLTNVIDVWKKLKNLYETSNKPWILLLQKNLTSLKMGSSYSITNDVQKL